MIELPPPDYVGWRVWEIARAGNAWNLIGPYIPAPWTPGLPSEGKHSSNVALGHGRLGGVYAYRERDLAKRFAIRHLGAKYRGRIYALGRVAMYGRIRTVADEIYAACGYPLSLDTTLDYRGDDAKPSADDLLALVRGYYLNAYAIASAADAITERRAA